MQCDASADIRRQIYRIIADKCKLILSDRIWCGAKLKSSTSLFGSIRVPILYHLCVLIEAYRIDHIDATDLELITRRYDQLEVQKVAESRLRPIAESLERSRQLVVWSSKNGSGLRF
jgi:hypothetical protein